MVSIDNIFGLFSHDDKDLSGEGKTTYKDLKNSPMYYVGMYKKLVLNHINFNKKVLNFFAKSNDELDINDKKKKESLLLTEDPGVTYKTLIWMMSRI